VNAHDDGTHVVLAAAAVAGFTNQRLCRFTCVVPAAQDGLDVGIAHALPESIRAEKEPIAATDRDVKRIPVNGLVRVPQTPVQLLSIR